MGFLNCCVKMFSVREGVTNKFLQSQPMCIFYLILINYCRPGSSVGIATDYRLDDLGSNLGGDEIFRPSRPALGATQPPIEWVPGLSQG